MRTGPPTQTSHPPGAVFQTHGKRTAGRLNDAAAQRAVQGVKCERRGQSAGAAGAFMAERAGGAHPDDRKELGFLLFKEILFAFQPEMSHGVSSATRHILR